MHMRVKLNSIPSSKLGCKGRVVKGPQAEEMCVGWVKGYQD